MQDRSLKRTNCRVAQVGHVDSPVRIEAESVWNSWCFHEHLTKPHECVTLSSPTHMRTYESRVRISRHTKVECVFRCVPHSRALCLCLSLSPSVSLSHSYTLSVGRFALALSLSLSASLSLAPLCLSERRESTPQQQLSQGSTD